MVRVLNIISSTRIVFISIRWGGGGRLMQKLLIVQILPSI